MKDQKKEKLSVRNATAPTLWLAICIWVTGAWLVNLASHWQYARSFQPLYLQAAIYLLLVVIALIFRTNLLGPSWFLFGALLIYVWTINIAADTAHPIRWVFLLCLMLLVYFLLEGIELAVTELRDKDPDVFDDHKISRAIKEINKKRGLFYDSREWMIVLLVVFLSIKSDFEKIELPMGLNRYPHAHTIFSLLFTTFIVVWLCQSPSKELATKNSVAFLKLAQFPRFWWPCIRMIGTVVEQIGLQEPSEWIVGKLSQLKPFRKPRDLRPSDAAYFLYGLKVFGYSLFKLQETVILNQDGTARFTQRGLFYVINGDPKEFGRWYEFDRQFKQIKRTIWAYFVAKPGETITPELQAALEEAFEDKPTKPGLRKSISAPNFSPRGSVYNGPNGTPRQDYLIKLPFDLGDPQNLVDKDLAALAVGFEISFEVDPDGFSLPSGPGSMVKDEIYKEVNFPWGRYELEVHLEIPGDVQFAGLVGEATILKMKSEQETKKMFQQALGNKHFKRYINYPLAGAKYIWHWEIWHQN
ncbi:MAG TPA: hypothetical protein VGJ00_08225 [Rhabdochlamydiaceae bacterium]|jgi:hypothetical protein